MISTLRVSVVCCIATAIAVLAAFHFLMKRAIPLVSSNAVERSTRFSEARPAAGRNHLRLVDYHGTASGLFGIPVVIPPKPIAPPAKQARATLTEPPDPLADFRFTGVVTLGGQEYALLE